MACEKILSRHLQDQREAAKYPFALTVVRSRKRRTLCIKVSIDGAVGVMIPYGLSWSRLHKSLAHHGAWINRQIEKQKTRPRPPQYTFRDGDRLPYLGKYYRLTVITLTSSLENDVARCGGCTMHRGGLVVELLPHKESVNKGVDEGVKEDDVSFDAYGDQKDREVRKRLLAWYHQRACVILTKQTHAYAPLVGMKPRSIKVSDYRSKWGSCSIDGNITYNWRLILAPSSVLEYVVVHELCHLRHHNHSAAFWGCVEKILPDFRLQQNYLKTHGAQLVI